MHVIKLSGACAVRMVVRVAIKRTATDEIRASINSIRCYSVSDAAVV